MSVIARCADHFGTRLSQLFGCIFCLFVRIGNFCHVLSTTAIRLCLPATHDDRVWSRLEQGRRAPAQCGAQVSCAQSCDDRDWCGCAALAVTFSAPSMLAAPAPVMEHISPAPAVCCVSPAPAVCTVPAPAVEYIRSCAMSHASLALAVCAAPAPCRQGPLSPAPTMRHAAPALVDHISPAPAVCVALAPVVKHVSPAPAESHAALAPIVCAVQTPMVECISPAPAVSYAAPAPAGYAVQLQWKSIAVWSGASGELGSTCASAVCADSAARSASAVGYAAPLQNGAPAQYGWVDTNRDGIPDVLQQPQIGIAPMGAAVCWRPRRRHSCSMTCCANTGAALCWRRHRCRNRGSLIAEHCRGSVKARRARPRQHP